MVFNFILRLYTLNEEHKFLLTSCFIFAVVYLDVLEVQAVQFHFVLQEIAQGVDHFLRNLIGLPTIGDEAHLAQGLNHGLRIVFQRVFDELRDTLPQLTAEHGYCPKVKQYDGAIRFHQIISRMRIGMVKSIFEGYLGFPSFKDTLPESTGKKGRPSLKQVEKMFESLPEAKLEKARLMLSKERWAAIRTLALQTSFLDWAARALRQIPTYRIPLVKKSKLLNYQ